MCILGIKYTNFNFIKLICEKNVIKLEKGKNSDFNTRFTETLKSLQEQSELNNRFRKVYL